MGESGLTTAYGSITAARHEEHLEFNVFGFHISRSRCDKYITSSCSQFRKLTSILFNAQYFYITSRNAQTPGTYLQNSTCTTTLRYIALCICYQRGSYWHVDFFWFNLYFAIKDKFLYCLFKDVFVLRNTISFYYTEDKHDVFWYLTNKEEKSCTLQSIHPSESSEFTFGAAGAIPATTRTNRSPVCGSDTG